MCMFLEKSQGLFPSIKSRLLFNPVVELYRYSFSLALLGALHLRVQATLDGARRGFGSRDGGRIAQSQWTEGWLGAVLCEKWNTMYATWEKETQSTEAHLSISFTLHMRANTGKDDRSPPQTGGLVLSFSLDTWPS